jgi:flavin reductase (DIM6/NTAB) family NADH-FMN oxidoreductase RutF
MNQVRLDSNLFIPMPVTLVGCLLSGRANFMTAGWVSRVNANPPWIGIGINRSHATAGAIVTNNSFSICFPRRADLAKADYCGLMSGGKVDKSGLFSVFYGDLRTAPLIAEASLNLECALVQTVSGPSNHFFIGEIKGAYAAPDCMEDGRFSPEKAGFLILTMPDNIYWTLGEKAGRAWEAGRELMGK